MNVLDSPRPGGLVRSLRPRPPHISLWALWSAASEANALDGREVVEVVKDLGANCASPWGYQDAGIPLERLQQGVERLFALPGRAASLAIGADFLPSLVRQRGWFHPSLAYCPACLAHGYHSLVFQHRALRRCPIHGAPLRYACGGCGRAAPTTFQAAATVPFGCPHCERPLAGARAGPWLPDDEIERRVGPSRFALVATLSPDTQANGSLCLVPHKDHPRPAVVLARRAARFCNWVDDDPYVLRPPRSSERLPLSNRIDPPEVVTAYQHIAYGDWLRRLLARFPEWVAASTAVVRRLQWNPDDPALGDTTSVGAIALGRLRFLYGGIPEEGIGSRLEHLFSQREREARPQCPPSFAQRGMVSWASHRANDRLLDCELNAMLAWLAMDTRSRVIRAGVGGIVWHAEPDATVIAPAWRITTAEEGKCLLFRPALGRDALDRLLRRTGGRPVEFPKFRR